EYYFKELMEFFLPDVAREIEWSKPHEFLDKELLAIQHASQVRKKNADKLVKVFKRNGDETIILVHIELQNRYEAAFSERMFQYYYRIYDKYKKPILSLAILTDNRGYWRPTEYRQELFGCS